MWTEVSGRLMQLILERHSTGEQHNLYGVKRSAGFDTELNIDYVLRRFFFGSWFGVLEFLVKCYTRFIAIRKIKLHWYQSYKSKRTALYSSTVFYWVRLVVNPSRSHAQENHCRKGSFDRFSHTLSWDGLDHTSSDEIVLSRSLLISLYYIFLMHKTTPFKSGPSENRRESS